MGHRLFQRPHAALGEPYGPPASVGFRGHHFRQTGPDHEIDIAGQGRLIQPGALGQRPDRVIRRGRNEAHQAELRRPDPGGRKPFVEKLRKLTGRAAQMPARIALKGVGGFASKAAEMLPGA